MPQRGARRGLLRGRGWSRAASRPRPGAEGGFTLIELVVAITVFSIVAGGIAAMAASGLNLSRNNRERSVAANLASADQDAALSSGFDVLADEIATPVVSNPVVGNTTYTVTRDVGWEERNAETSICDYTKGGAKTSWVIRVTSTVSWPGRPDGISPGEATTIVSPPVGFDKDLEQGTVPVTVTNPAIDPPAPVAQVPVFVSEGTGAATLAGTTNTDGCAFLLLDKGNYTVSLNLANHVDREGIATPRKTFALKKGGNVAATFYYAPAAEMTVTPLAPSSASVPPGVPLTLGYQFFEPGGTKTFVTALPGTISSLFPDAYDVWTGDCADADPASTYWTGASASLIEVPGAGTVEMGGVAVTATAGGSADVGKTVVATHSSTGGSCPTGSTSTSGLTLGTTDSAGELTSALPYGHWNITVGGGSPVSATVDPTGTSLVSVVVSS